MTGRPRWHQGLAGRPCRGTPAARTKARSRQSENGEPLHSFRTLLADPATLTRNTVRFGDALPMTVAVTTTRIQRRAFSLLGVGSRSRFFARVIAWLHPGTGRAVARKAGGRVRDDGWQALIRGLVTA
jgi:hypothetical protein